MRVITGLYRGLRLQTPDNMNIRPTSDKVKEAIFSTIQFLLPECHFLDLFSGSGQMGIEALSRGAKKCIFVDKNPALLKKNLSLLNKSSEKPCFEIFPHDVHTSIRLMSARNITADIVFMDPPYGKGIIPSVLKELPEVLEDGATVLCEHSTEDKLPDSVGELKSVKQKRYGQIMLTTYKYTRRTI